MDSSRKTFHFNKEITAEQLDFFDTHGYIHFKNFIDKDSLSNLVQEVGRVQHFLISNKIKKMKCSFIFQFVDAVVSLISLHNIVQNSLRFGHDTSGGSPLFQHI